jgi:hypothetical protein
VTPAPAGVAIGRRLLHGVARGQRLWYHRVEVPVYWLGVALLVVFVGIVLLMLVEIRQYRTGRRLISRRRFAMRMVGGGVMLALLAAIFVGFFLLDLSSPLGHPVLWMAWWGGCIVGGVVLMFVAMADAKEVESASGERERELWRDFARTLIGKSKGRGDSRTGSDEQR